MLKSVKNDEMFSLSAYEKDAVTSEFLGKTDGMPYKELASYEGKI